MANKIFRQVLCSERMPINKAYYYTNIGKILFEDGLFLDKYLFVIKPDWWLEEVELPSKGDALYESSLYAQKTTLGIDAGMEKAYYTHYAVKDFKAGFNKAIELIKGEGLNNG